jgi:hypothetical protein
MPAQGSRPRKIDIVILALILAIGIFLRLPPRTFSSSGPLHSIAALHPTPAYMRMGFDEGLYLVKEGITSYPNIVEGYIDAQQKLPGSILPPSAFFTSLLLIFGIASSVPKRSKRSIRLLGSLACSRFVWPQSSRGDCADRPGHLRSPRSWLSLRPKSTCRSMRS